MNGYNSMFGAPAAPQGMFGAAPAQTGMMGDPQILAVIQRLLAAGGPSATPQAMPAMGQMPMEIQKLLMALSQRGAY